MSGSDLWHGSGGAGDTRSFARWLLLGSALALLVAFVGVPAIQERTSSPCLGLEQLAVRTGLDLPAEGEDYRGQMVQVMANTLRRAGLTGAAGARAAARLQPSLPAPLGCLVGHWQVSLSPAEQAPAWLAAMDR